MLREVWLFLTIFKIVVADSPILPVGVPLKNASYYTAGSTFTCLDGSRTIPYEYVNDDYCDCDFDGSDEPGTAACPNGLFHCANIGFLPINIPSNRVNDGICDCCDGSDEYDSSKSCSNICDILGAEARKEQERLRQIYAEGYQIRLQLIEKGKELKKERLAKYEEVSKQVETAEIAKENLNKVKTQKEEGEKAALDVYKAIKEQERLQREQEEKEKDKQEAFETFVKIDKNYDKRIDLEELSLYEIRYHEDKTRPFTEDEAKMILGSEETIDFESFVSNGWSQFKQFKLSSIFEPSTPEQDIPAEEASKHDAEHEPTEQVDHHDEETDDDEETEDAEGRAELIEERENENVEGYDDHTLKLIEEANNARKEFEDADRIYRDLNREVKQLEDILRKDYGTSGEFAYMDGQCYELTDKEYTYQICPFDQVTQKQKSGAADVRLGRWQSWSNGYRSMLYTNGQSCWNGPNRQAEVIISCGLETEVTLASEPNRCVYLIHMNTPAACVLDENSEDNQRLRKHDEL